MKKASVALALMAVATLAVFGSGAPKIQFDSTTIDFGKTSQVEKLTGVFKFKNAGEATLKIEQPKPSCGCTVANLSKNSLEPGETGELPFTLTLGNSKALVEKHITVLSNDPKTPQVSLTVKADYTPLFTVSVTTLMPNVPLGGETNLSFTLSRSDGKGLGTPKFVSSKPWITAKADAGAKTNDSVVKIAVNIRPDGIPRRFNDHIQIYTGDESKGPISTVFIYGRVLGDLVLTPETLYWSIADREKLMAEKTESLITRRIQVRANQGIDFSIKSLHSSIPGIQLEAVPREMKKAVPLNQNGQPAPAPQVEKYIELVATMTDVPEKTVTGTVTFETTVPTQPKVELPMTIYVFNKKK